MALGGHLVPGNLVALCWNCNNKKLDSPPEQFYTPGELDRLKPILDQQEDVFSFIPRHARGPAATRSKFRGILCRLIGRVVAGR